MQIKYHDNINWWLITSGKNNAIIFSRNSTHYWAIRTSENQFIFTGITTLADHMTFEGYACHTYSLNLKAQMVVHCVFLTKQQLIRFSQIFMKDTHKTKESSAPFPALSHKCSTEQLCPLPHSWPAPPWTLCVAVEN